MNASKNRVQGKRRWILSAGMAVALVFSAGLALDWLLARDATYSYLRLFNEVLLLVDRNYVEETAITDLMEGAYDGLLSSLDPESEYLTREQYQRLIAKPGDDDGDVGIHLSRRGGYVFVVSVAQGSPADEAGFVSGTRIRRIDGVSTRELTLTESRLMLRGQVGTEVQVQRFPGDGEQETVALERTRYQQPQAESSRVRGHLVLRIPRLTKGSAEEARRVLQKAGALRGRLLIDLRGTSEGDYAEAARLASLFVEDGTIGRIRKRDGVEEILSVDGTSFETENLDIAVLVNRGTAGPAELLAQALRVRLGAELLGARTLGQASIQDFIPLADGAMVRLSVARCLGPGGEAWDPDGLEPDQTVDVGPDEASDGKDAVLLRAIELLEEDEEPELQAA